MSPVPPYLCAPSDQYNARLRAWASELQMRAEQHRQYARHMVREVLGVNLDELAKAAAL